MVEWFTANWIFGISSQKTKNRNSKKKASTISTNDFPFGHVYIVSSALIYFGNDIFSTCVLCTLNVYAIWMLHWNEAAKKNSLVHFELDISLYKYSAAPPWGSPKNEHLHKTQQLTACLETIWVHTNTAYTLNKQLQSLGPGSVFEFSTNEKKN